MVTSPSRTWPFGDHAGLDSKAAERRSDPLLDEVPRVNDDQRRLSDALDRAEHDGALARCRRGARHIPGRDARARRRPRPGSDGARAKAHSGPVAQTSRRSSKRTSSPHSSAARFRMLAAPRGMTSAPSSSHSTSSMHSGTPSVLRPNRIRFWNSGFGNVSCAMIWWSSFGRRSDLGIRMALSTSAFILVLRRLWPNGFGAREHARGIGLSGGRRERMSPVARA